MQDRPSVRNCTKMSKTKSSVDKLDSLGFDPIEAMVKQYQRLNDEIERQYLVQSGELVLLRADGKPKAYSAQYHMSIITQAAMLGEKLLRFGYARVDEKSEGGPIVAPVLNIHLSDKPGDVFTLSTDDKPTSDAE